MGKVVLILLLFLNMVVINAAGIKYGAEIGTGWEKETNIYLDTTCVNDDIYPASGLVWAEWKNFYLNGECNYFRPDRNSELTMYDFKTGISWEKSFTRNGLYASADWYEKKHASQLDSFDFRQYFLAAGFVFKSSVTTTTELGLLFSDKKIPDFTQYNYREIEAALKHSVQPVSKLTLDFRIGSSFRQLYNFDITTPDTIASSGGKGHGGGNGGSRPQNQILENTNDEWLKRAELKLGISYGISAKWGISGNLVYQLTSGKTTLPLHQEFLDPIFRDYFSWNGYETELNLNYKPFSRVLLNLQYSYTEQEFQEMELSGNGRNINSFFRNDYSNRYNFNCEYNFHYWQDMTLKTRYGYQKIESSEALFETENRHYSVMLKVYF